MTQLMASSCEPNHEPGIYHMTIILTNNNLIEGRQWNIRLENEDLIRRVSILSSDKKRAQFNTAHDFLGYCTTIQKPDELIDVLVVCNNYIRNNDIIKIIETFNDNRINLANIGITKCIFTVMFDEVDEGSNLNNASEFINVSKRFPSIESIHLITATPYQKFWKKLKKNNDINKLTNIRADICDEISPKILIKTYMQIKEHNIHYKNNELESAAYIIAVYNEEIKPRNNIFRLFAPPSKNIITHNDIKDFFLNENCIVVIINGTEKCIYFSATDKININEFNIIQFKKDDVLMYITLAELHTLYPSTSIVVTGFKCIERGITFQTKGFNFTDMIIPPIDNISSAIQIIGRSNGNKAFVQKHNIYISQKMYEDIGNSINYATKLISSNPCEIDETDFREKTEKEKDIVRWCTPQSITLSPDEFKYVTEKKGLKFQRNRAMDEIRKHSEIELDGYTSSMWNLPTDRLTAYNKNIIPLINAEKAGEVISLLHKKYKNQNIRLYSIYFDEKNYKIIVLKYNGHINND